MGVAWVLGSRAHARISRILSLQLKECDDLYLKTIYLEPLFVNGPVQRETRGLKEEAK
jgi:hypothetical protein